MSASLPTDCVVLMNRTEQTFATVAPLTRKLVEFPDSLISIRMHWFRLLSSNRISTLLAEDHCIHLKFRSDHALAPRIFLFPNIPTDLVGYKTQFSHLLLCINASRNPISLLLDFGVQYFRYQRWIKSWRLVHFTGHANFEKNSSNGMWSGNLRISIRWHHFMKYYLENFVKPEIKWDMTSSSGQPTSSWLRSK